MPKTSGEISTRGLVWFGLALMAVNVLGVRHALEAYRTGMKVHIMHSPDLEWWAAGGMAVLGIFVGLFAVAMGLGWIKSKSGRPM